MTREGDVKSSPVANSEETCQIINAFHVIAKKSCARKLLVSLYLKKQLLYTVHHKITPQARIAVPCGAAGVGNMLPVRECEETSAVE